MTHPDHSSPLSRTQGQVEPTVDQKAVPSIDTHFGPLSTGATEQEVALQKRIAHTLDAVLAVRPESAQVAEAFQPHQSAVEQLLTECLNPDRVTTLPVFPAVEQTAQIPDADFALGMLTAPDQPVFEIPGVVKLTRLSSGQGVHFVPSHARRTTNGYALGVASKNGMPVPHTMRAMRPEAFLNLLNLALQPHPTLQQFAFSGKSGEPISGWSAIRQQLPVSHGIEGNPVHKDGKVMDSTVLAPGGMAVLPGFGGIALGFSERPLSESPYALGDSFAGTSHTTIVAMLTDEYSDPALLTKKALGFPEKSEATQREISEGMYYSKDNPEERFNLSADGTMTPFKVTMLAPDGESIITLAVNSTYPGVVKKDKKAGISAAVNLRGMALEEHAGGAHIRPRTILAGETHVASLTGSDAMTFDEAALLLADSINVDRESRFATLNADAKATLIPEDAFFSTRNGTVSWSARNGESVRLPLDDNTYFMLPNGDLISTHRHGQQMQLIHTDAEGVLIRRNNTASAGGKTETSNSMLCSEAAVPVADLGTTISSVENLLLQTVPDQSGTMRLPLDPRLSAFDLESWLENASKDSQLGNYLDESSIAVVMTLKLNPNANGLHESWPAHFSVAQQGNETVLTFQGTSVTRTMALLGKQTDGTVIQAPLRHTTTAAFRLQTEDDISITSVQPASSISGLGGKRLLFEHVEQSTDVEPGHFNRPDEVLEREGVMPAVEARLAGQNLGPASALRSNILVNWELQGKEDAIAETMSPGFQNYHPQLQSVIRSVAEGPENGTYISPRKVTDENIRLQERAQLLEEPHLYEIAQLSRKLARHTTSNNCPLVTHAHMSGEKNTTLGENAPSLAFQGPLYLEFGMRRAISGLTGKSPSITSEGAEPGVEGPLTKFPFNYLQSFADLNTFAVSRALAGHTPFTTPSGEIGTDFVGHNMGYVMTETVARMSREELLPEALLAGGYIEPLPDLTKSDGTIVRGSLLGYRITQTFLDEYAGRVFSNPTAHFPERWLRPEIHDHDGYISGVEAVLRAQKRVATTLLEQGGEEYGSLAVRATLHMMASSDGTFRFTPPGEQGAETIWTQDHPDYLALFRAEGILDTPEYRKRLEAQQEIDIATLVKKISFAQRVEGKSQEVDRLTNTLQLVRSDKYLDTLKGSLGADPTMVRGQQAELAAEVLLASPDLQRIAHGHRA